MFCLQPLKIVEVHVKFLAPTSGDTVEWPMTIRNERAGELVAYFANGDQQKLFLDGVLMRPKVQILTDFLSKNDYAMDELDFGRVNVEKSRTIHVYLSNETDVTARWQLNYVKFPKKQTIGHNTTTPWEVENMEKTDDPEVFEFSVTGVSIYHFENLTLFLLFREHSKENPYRLERCQKVYQFHLYQKTKRNRNICHRKSLSNLSPKITFCTRANSDLFAKQEYHAILFSKDGDHMKKTSIDEKKY